MQNEKPVVPGLGNNQWEIKKSSLTKIKTLGKGQFGEVWHGKWENKIDVAVKEMNPGKKLYEFEDCNRKMCPAGNFFRDNEEGGLY